jgi:Cys-tRNA(Pro)/Cys-tRNA(Cys) deacylase
VARVGRVSPGARQAMRTLDAKGIAYRTVEYDESGEFHSGGDAARLVGAPPDRVYKTLVVLRDGVRSAKAMLVMLPVNEKVDLKALAQGLGEKKLRIATQREAESLTSLQVGGISALAIQKLDRFDVLIDERARELNNVHVSAGSRGVDLELSVVDLIGVTGARFVSVLAGPADQGLANPAVD